MKKLNQILGLAALALLAGTTSSQAVLLVHEGFNYGLADGTTFNGVATTATGYSGNYTVATGAAGGAGVYSSTGLTFSSNFFATANGAANLTTPAQPSPTGTSAILGGTLSIGGAQTGNIYSSYLVNYGTKEPVFSGAAAQLRISDLQTSGSNNRFLTFADNGANLNNGVSFSGASTNGSQALVDGTTYLMVAKYTNVGTIGATGTATLWLFDSASYDLWFTGGASEAALDTFALGGPLVSAGVTTTAIHTFTNGDFTQFTISGTNGSAAQSIFYDELRYGTTLEDVVMVPEPSTYALMLGGLLLFLVVRRKRCAV
jgi:hypothetical protein